MKLAKKKVAEAPSNPPCDEAGDADGEKGETGENENQGQEAEEEEAMELDQEIEERLVFHGVRFQKSNRFGKWTHVMSSRQMNEHQPTMI